jgi:ABC-type sugar transport system permease subunit
VIRRRFATQFSGVNGVNWKPYLYVLPLVIMYVGFMFYPLFRAFEMSFQTFPTILQGEWVGLTNFRNLYNDQVFWTSLKNTAIMAIGRAGLPVAIGLLWAIIINRVLKGYKSTVVRTILFIPLVVPIVVGGVLFGWIFSTKGIGNSFLLSIGVIDQPIRWLSSDFALPTVMVLAAWRYSGYYMVIILAGLQAIPEEVYESAKIQNISTWRRFRHITLPLIKPSLIIVTILGLLGTIKGFAYVWVLTQGGPGRKTEVLSTYFYKQTFHYYNFGKGAALAWVMFAVTLVLSLIIVRRSN